MSISRINNNITALNAYTNLDRAGRRMTQSIERLSSGLRINRAGDDAAGMTIATRLKSQVRGLDRAMMNAEDGINLINVAESSMEEMTQRLDRIRVLAIQAANTGVNDIQARQAIQDEVFQSIDEIARIANTTQFGTNKLLNGTYGVTAEIKAGQDGAQNFGVRIDQGPGANTLASGTHFLNIIQTKKGYEQFLPGYDESTQTFQMHTGVTNATDIAVSLARFSSSLGLGGTAATTTATLGNGGFFNGVSVHDGDILFFQGVLSDGVTKFSGSVSASASTQIGASTDTASSSTRLLGAINQAIDHAEAALWGVPVASVPSSFQTTVTLADSLSNNQGRLLLVGHTEAINLASIDFVLIRNTNVVTRSEGVVRSAPIGAHSALTGVGQIGNAIAAITGSTFATGQFAIEVTEVQGPQNRTIDGSLIFRDHAGSVISRTASLVHPSRGLRLNGTFVDGVYTGGVSISDGDTITIRGTEADGTTFETAYTLSRDVSTDAVLNDFTFGTISGLIQELNYRTRDYVGSDFDGTLSRWESGMVTYTAEGKLQLVDDLGRDHSQLDFTLTFNDSISSSTPSYTLQDRGILTKEGFAEAATIRINGGEAVRARAGEMVTVHGAPPTQEGEVQSQVTFRLGSNLKNGQDLLETQAQEFVGRLNNGPAVTFQNGAQDVVFIEDGSYKRGVARFLTVDFDAILDITAAPPGKADPGTTLLLSAVNDAMNFHIGAFAEQSFQTSIGNLSAENLGFGRNSGRTVQDIDVTTIAGANEALRIVDLALGQINRTRSLLGAATNRLESTVNSLAVSGENLQSSESRLRDADIAKESTHFAKEQVLIQAGVSVLAQANFLPQSLLSLLG
ncbi:MAG: flagellin [bacterium]|jgi:flagellin|nr:flagellin [bacterium]